MAELDEGIAARQDLHVGRPAAGEDPAKRAQILDGAQCVFMRLGFDATSMNDITREAGVSKGTLYVYFKNKEDLFAAIIERRKLKIFGQMQDVLERDLPIERTLTDFGLVFVTNMLSDNAIRGARVVIGVLDRMPQLSTVFFATGPNSGPMLLASYLRKQIAFGRLKPIDDVMLVGRRFGDLCLAGLFRPRLFGEMPEPPSDERIGENVEWAVTLFLNTYGAKPRD